jgi:hypothetical protein
MQVVQVVQGQQGITAVTVREIAGLAGAPGGRASRYTSETITASILPNRTTLVTFNYGVAHAELGFGPAG